MNKKYNHYKDSDSFFIYLKEGENNFEEIAPGINIEFNKEGKIIWVEILRASRFLKSAEKEAIKYS